MSTSATSPVTHCRRRQAGISLIELIMFIIIVGAGIAGILTVMSTVTKNSADPMVRKQAIMIAESLLEEIELQPFTYCDPDDANLETATQATVGVGETFCQTNAQVLGPSPAAETRTGAPRFDNVGDYHRPLMTSVVDINGNPIAGLAAYQAGVTMTQSGTAFGFPAGDVLKINVRVTGPADTNVTVTGYRFRYAPNTGP